jgi:hypothetical protein
LWRVGGVRCKTIVNNGGKELLLRMRDAGCVNIQYGMESGSEKMLGVMEKKTKLNDNVQVAKWTNEAKIYTTFAIVLGMPGENKETVKETAKFLADCTYDLPEPPYGRISINRLEALPGTPVYEFGKINGFIGKTPQLEEEYLIKISDTSGAEFWNQLNFTDYPDFIVEKWRRDLWFEIMNSWFRNHLEEQSSLFTIFKKGLKTVFLSGQDRLKIRFEPVDIKTADCDEVDMLVDKDFNFHRNKILETSIRIQYHNIFYVFRSFAIIEVIIRNFFNNEQPKSIFFKKLKELLLYYCNRGPKRGEKTEKYDFNQSMRKIVNSVDVKPISYSEKNLMPLQKGR